MKIELELYELKNLCRDMSSLGAANVIRSLEPTSDEIGVREANAWLKSLGHAGTTLSKLESLEMIKAHRKGKSVNSKRYYSKAELLEALMAAGMKGIINKPLIYYYK